jgi:hypothetical protein
MWRSSAAQHHPVTLAIARNSATLPGKFQILKHPKGSSYNGNPALREVHHCGNTFRYTVHRLLLRICCSRVIRLVLHHQVVHEAPEVRCATVAMLTSIQ